MVDYWLGPKWEGIDEDNPMRIAFIFELSCDFDTLFYKIDDYWFLKMAKAEYDESVLDNV